jgi:hypothetical protein
LGLLDLFRRRRDAPEALAGFLHAQAAFVAQKTVVDYCQVKAGLRAPLHFANADFQAALQHCRWQVFFAAASDLTAMIEALLRPLVPASDAALAAALARRHAEAIRAEPPPAGEVASGEARIEALPRHLAALQAAPPLPADRLPLLAEPVLFATLPIHPDQRPGEEPAIRGALRFHVVSTGQEFERRFDLPAVARFLTAG